ncbi:MBL fold metallo-hydrolase [Pseudonocardia sp. D17]|uniref:MBL fold metallo-hydrolase n=1 Tax=Pseudonocardia sp. D17 TaxID=882661 RepID=UPI002B38D4B9|nr:hypothetical protein PSD17_04680 [Pseudonocardia sp. D17]
MSDALPGLRFLGHSTVRVELGGRVVLTMDTLGDLDVALLPVWGWGPTLGPGHLDPDRAAHAVERLRPRLAVPVHWGTLALPGLVRAPGGAGARMRRLLVEPPRQFASAVAADGGPTRVAVVEPGGRV